MFFRLLTDTVSPARSAGDLMSESALTTTPLKSLPDSPAAAVPGVINGEFDFAFGNIVSLMVAQDQGLPLEFVTNGTTTAGEAGKDFSGVVVNADSDIKSPADLAGETVSVNNLKNIGDTTICLLY